MISSTQPKLDVINRAIYQVMRILQSSERILNMSDYLIESSWYGMLLANFRYEFTSLASPSASMHFFMENC